MANMYPLPLMMSLEEKVRYAHDQRMTLANGEERAATVLDDPDPRNLEFYCIACDVTFYGSNLMNHVRGSYHEWRASGLLHERALTPEAYEARVRNWVCIGPLKIAPSCEPRPFKLFNDPLIGLECVAKVWGHFSPKPNYHCLLCDKICGKSDGNLVQHLMTFKHRIRYLKEYFPRASKAMEACPDNIWHVAKSIEDIFGRSRPIIVSEAAMVWRKDEIIRFVVKGACSQENDEPRFKRLLDTKCFETRIDPVKRGVKAIEANSQKEKLGRNENEGDVAAEPVNKDKVELSKTAVYKRKRSVSPMPSQTSKASTSPKRERSRSPSPFTKDSIIELEIFSPDEIEDEESLCSPSEPAVNLDQETSVAVSTAMEPEKVKTGPESLRSDPPVQSVDQTSVAVSTAKVVEPELVNTESTVVEEFMSESTASPSLLEQDEKFEPPPMKDIESTKPMPASGESYSAVNVKTNIKPSSPVSANSAVTLIPQEDILKDDKGECSPSTEKESLSVPVPRVLVPIVKDGFAKNDNTELASFQTETHNCEQSSTSDCPADSGLSVCPSQIPPTQPGSPMQPLGTKNSTLSTRNLSPISTNSLRESARRSPRKSPFCYLRKSRSRSNSPWRNSRKSRSMSPRRSPFDYSRKSQSSSRRNSLQRAGNPRSLPSRKSSLPGKQTSPLSPKMSSWRKSRSRSPRKAICFHSRESRSSPKKSICLRSGKSRSRSPGNSVCFHHRKPRSRSPRRSLCIHSNESRSQSPRRHPGYSLKRSPSKSPQRSLRKSRSRTPQKFPQRSSWKSRSRSPRKLSHNSLRQSPQRYSRKTRSRSRDYQSSTRKSRSRSPIKYKSHRWPRSCSPRNSPQRYSRKSRSRSPKNSYRSSTRKSRSRSPRNFPERSSRRSHSPRRSPQRYSSKSRSRSPRNSHHRSYRNSRSQSPRKLPQRSSRNSRSHSPRELRHRSSRNSPSHNTRKSQRSSRTRSRSPKKSSQRSSNSPSSSPRNSHQRSSRMSRSLSPREKPSGKRKCSRRSSKKTSTPSPKTFAESDRYWPPVVTISPSAPILPCPEEPDLPVNNRVIRIKLKPGARTCPKVEELRKKELERRKKEEERKKKELLLQNYTEALEVELAAKFKFFKKAPEKHPLYTDEFAKFLAKWSERVKAKGKGSSKGGFKCAWNKFWSKRNKEFNESEMEVRLKAYRVEIGLLEEEEKNSELDSSNSSLPSVGDDQEEVPEKTDIENAVEKWAAQQTVPAEEEEGPKELTDEDIDALLGIVVEMAQEEVSSKVDETNPVQDDLNLDDVELESLFRNFFTLTDAEKLYLMVYLKKLEAVDPLKVARCKKLMIAGDDSQETSSPPSQESEIEKVKRKEESRNLAAKMIEEQAKKAGTVDSKKEIYLSRLAELTPTTAPNEVAPDVSTEGTDILLLDVPNDTSAETSDHLSIPPVDTSNNAQGDVLSVFDIVSGADTSSAKTTSLEIPFLDTTSTEDLPGTIVQTDDVSSPGITNVFADLSATCTEYLPGISESPDVSSISSSWMNTQPTKNSEASTIIPSVHVSEEFMNTTFPTANVSETPTILAADISEKCTLIPPVAVSEKGTLIPPGAVSEKCTLIPPFAVSEKCSLIAPAAVSEKCSLIAPADVSEKCTLIPQVAVSEKPNIPAADVSEKCTLIPPVAVSEKCTLIPPFAVSQECTIIPPIAVSEKCTLISPFAVSGECTTTSSIDATAVSSTNASNLSVDVSTNHGNGPSSTSPLLPVMDLCTNFPGTNWQGWALTAYYIQAANYWINATQGYNWYGAGGNYGYNFWPTFPTQPGQGSEKDEKKTGQDIGKDGKETSQGSEKDVKKSRQGSEYDEKKSRSGSENDEKKSSQKSEKDEKKYRRESENYDKKFRQGGENDEKKTSQNSEKDEKKFHRESENYEKKFRQGSENYEKKFRQRSGNDEKKSSQKSEKDEKKFHRESENYEKKFRQGSENCEKELRRGSKYDEKKFRQVSENDEEKTCQKSEKDEKVFRRGSENYEKKFRQGNENDENKFRQGNENDENKFRQGSVTAKELRSFGLIEQRNLLNIRNIIASGVPEAAREDCIMLAAKIARRIGMHEQDVSAAHRDSFFQRKPRPLIIILKSEDQPQVWLHAYNRAGSVFACDLNPSFPLQRIFLNEHLPGHKRRLLGKARERAREIGFRFVWTIGGNVLMKKNERSEVIHIESETALETLPLDGGKLVRKSTDVEHSALLKSVPKMPLPTPSTVATSQQASGPAAPIRKYSDVSTNTAVASSTFPLSASDPVAPLQNPQADSLRKDLSLSPNPVAPVQKCPPPNMDLEKTNLTPASKQLNMPSLSPSGEKLSVAPALTQNLFSTNSVVLQKSFQPSTTGPVEPIAPSAPYPSKMPQSVRNPAIRNPATPGQNPPAAPVVPAKTSQPSTTCSAKSHFTPATETVMRPQFSNPADPRQKTHMRNSFSSNIVVPLQKSLPSTTVPVSPGINNEPVKSLLSYSNSVATRPKTQVAQTSSPNSPQMQRCQPSSTGPTKPHVTSATEPVNKKQLSSSLDPRLKPRLPPMRNSFSSNIVVTCLPSELKPSVAYFTDPAKSPQFTNLADPRQKTHVRNASSMNSVVPLQNSQPTGSVKPSALDPRKRPLPISNSLVTTKQDTVSANAVVPLQNVSPLALGSVKPSLPLAPEQKLGKTTTEPVAPVRKYSRFSSASAQ